MLHCIYIVIQIFTLLDLLKLGYNAKVSICVEVKLRRLDMSSILVTAIKWLVERPRKYLMRMK